jgi:hypothetical protein
MWDNFAYLSQSCFFRKEEFKHSALTAQHLECGQELASVTCVSQRNRVLLTTYPYAAL